MPLVELTEKEHFIIEVLRQFGFLRKLEYDIKGLEIYTQNPKLIFESWKAKRIIVISWTDLDAFRLQITSTVRFSKKQIFIHDLYSQFHSGYLDLKINLSNYCEIIKKNAEFVKVNLIKVINGDSWISPMK